MKKIVLMDGHSILNRAFYGVPELTNSKGLHTNAVYGFLNILFKIIDEEKPDCLTVAFDVKHPTFRHERYAEYKGTRKPMPYELHEQVPVIKEVLKAMNITVVERPGYEADDILGTIAGIAEKNGYTVTIVSGDRDLLQLVTDKVTLRIPKTRAGKTVVEDYNPAMVKETYQLEPKQIIDLKGLMGDSSDNIPGLPGVGEKTATKLLLEYGSVENVIAHAEEVKPNKAKNAVMEHSELAILSKELATIKTDCELEYSLDEAAIEDMFNREAYEQIKQLEFKSMLARFEGASLVKEEVIEPDIVTGVNELDERITSISKSDSPIAVYILRDKSLQYGVFGVVVDYSDSEKPLVFLDNEENVSPEYELAIQNTIKCVNESGVDIVMYDVKEQLDFLQLPNQDKVWDAGVAAYLINPLKDSYSGDDIARDYLDEQIQSYSEKFGKATIWNAYREDRDSVVEFAVKQARVLRQGFEVIKNRLIQENMYALYTDIEMPLVFSLYNMEKVGIGINKEELKEYGDSLTSRISELEAEIYGYAGEEFNINSPKQLGVILFEKLKLPFAKKTKTGYSTSADILEKLRLEDPIVPAVLEYRQLTKLKSTYADGLAGYIGEDGRIHGKFNQTITATGRISSTEPNLQNIPIRMELGRQIRKVFVPKEGCIFLDADYSQIELRVLAHMSGDESLIEAYNEGQDIHSITASKVFHVPVEEVTSDLRRKAKAVNFGIIYGISSFGLGQDLNISRKEADEYIARYFETYPKIKAFLDGLVSDAKKDGYSNTIFGRKRPIPELASSNFMQRSFGERVAMNAPIQGTAADIIKLAMLRVEKRLADEGLKSKLILQVHDELLLEVPYEEEDMAAKILEEEMVGAVNLSVKMVVEVERGSNWYEAK